MEKSVLSPSQVKHLAKLANLKLTSKEIKLFQKQLSQVLDYFTLLNELDTEKVEPTAQVTGLENVYKEDRPGFCLSPEEALKNTKKKHNKLFKVPSVFE